MARSSTAMFADLLLACYLANATCAIINVMTALIFIIVSRSHALSLVVAVCSFLHGLVAVVAARVTGTSFSLPNLFESHPILFNFGPAKFHLQHWCPPPCLLHADCALLLFTPLNVVLFYCNQAYVDVWGSPHWMCCDF